MAIACDAISNASVVAVITAGGAVTGASTAALTANTTYATRYYSMP